MSTLRAAWLGILAATVPFVVLLVIYVIEVGIGTISGADLGGHALALFREWRWAATAAALTAVTINYSEALHERRNDR
ncbi:hypothetical protein IU500_07070 [Nocardia terpenica]|uniref:hypothetical protein n=1 Tax=Nocardia terpenica TaxID=455432 RepID=UPI00189553AE|nr:hypothetical protein [Nocardia terpenica]MBF6060538.1 hypothetical protein [Nocardia terpenica]MBF6103798.1 hypothetical protein [Nocardia terpenica]MBF6111828.1 hypothetical protein [Nocardia terpenica]MBF6118019.1 hypothetical protein [Nocardia terpenica]MBF6155255.1 hypothetical protein [Nocardia terpenica]